MIRKSCAQVVVLAAAAMMIFFNGLPVLADVTLPRLLSDHMVIQRGVPFHVWGFANPQEAITVSFRGESKGTTADGDGRWSLYLAPSEAGGPFELTIKATNTMVLEDVMVGDVWVASGQSNMEFPMTGLTNADAEIAAAKFPKIRIFHVDQKPSDFPLEYVKSKGWEECTPKSVASSSAVAYFFARNLQQKLGVPIGLVESYWGGTPAESWTSLNSLTADAALMPVFAARAKTVAAQATTVLRQNREEQEYQKTVDQAKTDGKPAPSRAWHPDFAAWAPAALFNGMIAPLTPFGIRGVIWYQGEANSGPDRAPLYAHVFQTMIRDWRQEWGLGDFPFLFVQIANFNAHPEDLWPEVRDAQRRALALRNTGMAVAIDIGEGEDIHPKNKQDVGLRLSLAARAIAFGEQVEWSGPLYRQVTSEDHSLRVWFDHAQGLAAKNGALVGFEIAGADGKYVPAEARIDGASVSVSSASVAEPISVRYGWAANPTCNLVNREGLPASPFQASE